MYQIIVALVMGVIWLVLTFVVNPLMIKRGIFRAIERGEYNEQILQSIRALLNSKLPGSEQTFLEGALTVIWEFMHFRATQVLNGSKSAIARNIQNLEDEGNPLLPLAGKILPKKYAGLAQYLPEIMAFMNKGTGEGGGDHPNKAGRGGGGRAF